MPFFRRKASDKPVKSPSSGSGLIRASSARSSVSSLHSPSTPDSWGDESDIGIPYQAFNGVIPSERRPRTLTLSESVLLDGPVTPEDSLESPLRTSSRLSKTLLEIVRDKDALACFKAFLRSQVAEHLIQFWCEAESFHASTLMRLRTQSLQSISKGAIHKRRSDGLKSCTSPQAQQETLPVLQKTLPVVLAPDVNSCGRVEAGVGEGISCDSRIVNDTLVLDDSGATVTQISYDPPCQQAQTSSDNIGHTQPPSDICVTISQCPDFIPSNICDSTINNDSNGYHQMQPEGLNCSAPEQQTQPPEAIQSTEATQPAEATQSAEATQTAEEASDGSKSNNEGSQEDLAVKLKKSIERDAVTIFSTYLAKDAPKPIGVDNDLRAEAISKICKEDGQVDPECFLNCQRFVLKKLDEEYYQSFKDSEFHCRHQVNLLTSDKVYLPDILLNENALCYFMEFMEQEGASDLMQMWLAADNFQQQLISTNGSYDRDQAQIDAMVIYDRYFSLQATNPVGFDDKLRFEVEGNICREGGPLPGCFTKAKNIVLKIIDKLYFNNYLQSQVYYRYLSDLISTVQMSEDVPSRGSQRGHKRTESDASSEHSAGSHSTGAESVVSRNTLLAVDTRKLKKVGVIDGDFSMNLDMLNPDALWKRPAAKSDSSSIASNLILGSVNEFGQFVSHFEQDAEAEKKKGPVLFKRRKEKEKEEEEMALRIAQMIISDVNTMTKTGESMHKNPRTC